MGYYASSQFDDDQWRRTVRIGAVVLILVLSLTTVAVVHWCVPTTRYCRVSATTWRHDLELQQRGVEHDSGWGRPWSRDVIKIECHSKYYGQQDCMCSF